MTQSLPPRPEMLAAFLDADPGYEGVFVTAVKTTGIFCRPTCRAKKPRPENVDFYPAPRDALLAGYRPCLRCRPLEAPGAAPDWLQPLLDEVLADPAAAWSDAALRRRGIAAERARRWFKAHHGMTFQGYVRALRLGRALGRIRHGEPVTAAAFDQGYESLSGFHEAFRNLLGVPPTRARELPTVTVNRLATPLGPLVACVSDAGVHLLEFADRRMLATQLRRMQRATPGHLLPGTHPHLDALAAQLDAYFAGDLETFDVPLAAPGSPFQEAVWREIAAIPHGETLSYGEIARRIGRPGAVRAVGRATGDNRLAILVPCHRVVGGDGRLTGYGGGLWRKRRLLELERSARSSAAKPSHIAAPATAQAVHSAEPPNRP
jgi:AraC family transcriptional regulator, regulatory protein of adaptative response / methylated-DNA-[protein]-cysteine methyltransferase